MQISSIVLGFSSEKALGSALAGTFLPTGLGLSVSYVALVFGFYVGVSHLTSTGLRGGVLFHYFVFCGC